MYLTVYNTFVTALAVCGLGVWDKDLDISKSKDTKLLDQFLPFIYKESQEN